MRHGHHHTPCRPSQELGCPSPDSLGVRPTTSESPNPPKNPSRSSTETARIGQQSASVPVRTEPAPNTIAGRRRTRPSSATDRESASTVVSPRNVEQTGVVPSVPMEPPPSVPKGRQVEPTFGAAAYQFAKGVPNGVAAESHKIYEDTKALPQRLFTTGKQVVEDVERGRPLRALSPLRAVAHAVRKASLDDVDRIAQATIEGAKEWWAKPPYEKGEEVGRVASFLSKDVVLVAAQGSLAPADPGYQSLQLRDRRVLS